MTPETREILTNAGMEVDSALERFMGSDAMLERFLQKFRKDPSYSSLVAAVAEEKLEDAFHAAHTLKGVAANFSFEALRSIVSDQTEEFRAGRLEAGIALMPKVTEEYERVCVGLARLYGEE